MIRLRIADPHAVWKAALTAIVIDPSLGSDEEFSKSGSGIIIAEAIVLTNEHVVAGCKQVAVAPGIPARVLAADADKDLAVIKAAIPLGAPVPISNGNTLGEDADLFTGGFPGIGLNDPDFAMTSGRLSSRKLSGDDIKNYWLLTNQINPGNSGGPLMDETGLVVGVVSAELPVTGIVKKNAPKNARDGMAIRAETVRGFLDDHKIAFESAEKGPLANAAADMRHHAAAASVLVECFED